jgi:hypothetical protein
MTDFVADLTDLPAPKTDLTPLPGTVDPTNAITAADWNAIRQAALDLRTFVLSAQVNKKVIAFLGDSNFCSMGATTDNMSRQPNVLVPNTSVMLDKIYGTSSSEPVPLTDMGRGFLRASNASSFPGFGPELSFGKEIYDLLNGFGAMPTASNRPWLLSFSIAGVQLSQLLKTSTYGQATPAFGGRNAYGAFVARVQALLATTGRQLGLLIGNLGPNDGADATLASQVAAHWVTLWGQLQGDLGTGFPLMLLQMNPNADSAFRPTVVRPQIALAASQIPGCALVEQVEPWLNSDNLHLGSRRIWTVGGRMAADARDQLALLPRTTATPAVRGYGEPEMHPVSGSSTTLRPCAYPMTQALDLQLLLCGSMKNSGSYVAIPSPTVPAAGWVQLGNSSQAISGQTQGFALFSRPTSQVDVDTNNRIPPGAVILLSNDESYCKLLTLFGAGALALDGSVITFSETGFSNTAFSASGPTTTKPNALVVIAFVTQGGGLSPTEHFTVSNTNLANLAIVSDEPYGLNTGNFGVLVFAAGTKVTPGAVGNTTITKSASFSAAVCGFVAAFGAA